MENVILVDEQDRPLGEMEKLEAHLKGALHRAVSVFVFNQDGTCLLHQRALSKYHSGGLWTNAACTHPRPNEDNLDSGRRRLQEEMGFETDLIYAFSHLYRAELDNDLIEHELDHCMYGFYDGEIQADADEVMDYRWVDMYELQSHMDRFPDMYTAWFQQIFPKMLAHLKHRFPRSA